MRREVEEEGRTIREGESGRERNEEKRRGGGGEGDKEKSRGVEDMRRRGREEETRR